MHPYERPESGRQATATGESAAVPWYEIITIVIFSGQATLATMHLHRYGFSWGRGILAAGSAALVLGACGTLIRRWPAKNRVREP